MPGPLGLPPAFEGIKKVTGARKDAGCRQLAGALWRAPH